MLIACFHMMASGWLTTHPQMPSYVRGKTSKSSSATAHRPHMDQYAK